MVGIEPTTYGLRNRWVARLAGLLISWINTPTRKAIAMTVEQILFDLGNIEPKKPISKAGLYKMFRKFKIKPLTHDIRPAHYPSDTPLRIRLRVGLLPARGATVKTVKLAGVRVSKSRP